MESEHVSIILVTWNSAPYLRRCLEGIREQTYAARELIVVDNASTDASVDLTAADATHVIRNDTNRGFSAAVNQALALARGELVLLVNPDCCLEPDYIERLVSALDEAGPEFGSATGLIMRARGWDIEPTSVVDSAGMRMTRSGRHFDIGRIGPIGPIGPIGRGPTGPIGPIRPIGPTGPLEVFGVSGAAALHRVAFLRDVAIGGEVFDEDFFAYREDADLAWRGQLMGWRALCEPRAIAYHVRRVTPEARRTLSAEINMHSVKNRFLLRLKNEGAYLALRNAPFELARDLVVVLATLTMERSSLPALAWLWRNRARVLAKRREIQRRRKVSDRKLARWFR
jgi:GT2 family glycosyltransferase